MRMAKGMKTIIGTKLEGQGKRLGADDAKDDPGQKVPWEHRSSDLKISWKSGFSGYSRVLEAMWAVKLDKMGVPT